MNFSLRIVESMDPWIQKSSHGGILEDELLVSSPLQMGVFLAIKNSMIRMVLLGRRYLPSLKLTALKAPENGWLEY